MPVVDLSIDSSGSIKGLGTYDKAVDKSEKSTKQSFNSMEGSVKKLAGIFATYQLGQFFVDFTKRAISAASDMEETQGKFDVVFRDLGTYAEDAAKRISDSYGMSKRESKLYMSSLQDLLVPSGLARDKAAEMSIAFTELAADLGSFNNVPTAQVVRDIQSALAGGSETMTKYGIDVKVSAVKAEMLALGMDTSTKAAKRQSRTIALLSIMQRDSSDAMGDFARTQASFANQNKIAQANIEDFVTLLGQKLLPIANQVVTAFNNWITTGDRMNTIVDYSIEAVRFLVNGYFGLEIVLKGTIVVIAKLAEGFVNLAAPMNVVLDAMVKVGAIDSNPIAELQNVMEQFTASAIDGLGTTWDRVEKFNASMDRAKTTTEKTTDAIVSGTAAATPAIEAVTSEVETNLIPAEVELEQKVKAVTAATKASTSALQQQATAATSVASAAQAIQSSGGSIGRAADPGYESWGQGLTLDTSIGADTFGGLPLGMDTSIDSGSFGGGSLSQEYIDNWRPATPGFDLGYGDLWERPESSSKSNVIVNNFNQQVSKSDIVEITQQQTTNGARA